MNETVVTITGEIDVSNREMVLDGLMWAMSRYGPHLSLDLSCVSFLDCAALPALISARQYAQRNDGSYRVITASHHVGKIAELTGLQDLLMPLAGVVAAEGHGRSALRNRSWAGR